MHREVPFPGILQSLAVIVEGFQFAPLSTTYNSWLVFFNSSDVLRRKILRLKVYTSNA